MSRLFLEDGESVPVTAVSVCGNFIADIKTSERDGYNAFVVSKTTKSNNINKAKSEFYKKINLEPGILAEFRSSEEISEEYDCLLYTSPSPRDLSTSRMPSSA